MTNDDAHPSPYTEEDDHVDAKTEAKHLTPEKEIKRQNTEEDHAAPQPTLLSLESQEGLDAEQDDVVSARTLGLG